MMGWGYQPWYSNILPNRRFKKGSNVGTTIFNIISKSVSNARELLSLECEKSFNLVIDIVMQMFVDLLKRQ